MTDHKNFHLIPNIVSDLGLDPFSYCLYAIIKRISGESGNCYMSLPKLAKKCSMSIERVRKSRKILACNFEKLNNTPLIEVQKRTNEEGDPDTDLIKVCDIWEYNNQPTGSPLPGTIKDDLPGSSPLPEWSDATTRVVVHTCTTKTTLKKNIFKKTTTTIDDVDVHNSKLQIYPELEFLKGLSQDEKISIYKNNSHEEVLAVLAYIFNPTFKVRKSRKASFYHFLNHPQHIDSDPLIKKENLNHFRERFRSYQDNQRNEKSEKAGVNLTKAFNYTKNLNLMNEKGLKLNCPICNDLGYAFPDGTFVPYEDENFDVLCLDAIAANNLPREEWFYTLNGAIS